MAPFGLGWMELLILAALVGGGAVVALLLVLQSQKARSRDHDES